MKCFVDVVKSGVWDIKSECWSLVASLGQLHSNLLGVQKGFPGFDLEDILGRNIKVGFGFLQGPFIRDYSGADFCHEVSKEHNFFLLYFLEAFSHVSLQIGHHQKKFITDCGCQRFASWRSQ
eukprot:8858243-Ditylum_brightwellii.AAC.1